MTIPLAAASVDVPGLAWHPHPDVWLLVGFLAGGYVLAMRRLGPRYVHPVERPATRGQVTCFMLGVATLWIASDWPVHELSESYLYSMHMVQHLLISLVVPPLLLLGTPAWLARLLLPGVLLNAARTITRPFIALVVFNTVVVLTHWPELVEASVRSEPVHFSLHALLFVSALAMWTPVFSPLLELPRLPYPGQMVYLFLQSLVPTIPASFLTFGETVVYRHYETVPRLWGITAITDQRVAGLVMKLVGGLILWGVIAVLFFKWFAKEQSEGVDVLSFHNVDRELNRASLDTGTPPRRSG